jgi:alkanesulfonate monooxygenase SsuD/methylene tetrahydromethanopterin reductase-like flavin-dependent oxidoreductase (luciferase family)
MGYLLPLYNPIRLIQEICMLDQMSRGRLEIGVGRGISALELAFYNVDAEESRDIFREALEIVTAGLATGIVNHEGQHFSFHDVRFQIRAYQHPYPPLWYPTNYPESFPYMARHGMNTLLHRVTAAQAGDLFNEYRSQLASHAEDGDRLNAHVVHPKFGLVRLVHVAETDEAAFRQAKASFEYFQDNMGFLSRTRGARPSPGVQVRAMHGFEDEIEEGRYLVGSPETVARLVEEQVRTSGCNYFVGAFATGNLTTEQVLRSVSLFAERVMPQFRSLAHAG